MICEADCLNVVYSLCGALAFPALHASNEPNQMVCKKNEIYHMQTVDKHSRDWTCIVTDCANIQ